MKILNLKFKNINSLSGETEIDFTNPVFTIDGLFAITGKTGAGKSSILDAISLALYGKTPRVDITANENPVMTRGEKDCYAEIIFEVAGEKWNSSWQQELNRNGNLKPVKRIISNFENKIIADQIRSCDAEIVKILGLTFEQFTKVIMLAQGSFAAFLQADKNDKGQLLEQITGTEIYAQISMAVYERNNVEKKKLEAILIELGAIKILTDEEIEELKNENAEIEKQKNQVDDELQKIDKAKNWLLDLVNLQKQIEDAKQKLPELKEKYNTALDAFKEADRALKTAKEEQEKQEPIFRKVIELDINISEKKQLLQPILEDITELENNKNNLSESLESQTLQLKEFKNSLSEKRNWAIKHKIYEELVSNYSAIEKENNLLLESANEIKNINSEIVNLQNEVGSKNQTFNSAAQAFAEKENNLTEKTKELKAKRIELANILGGKELSKLRTEKENLTNLDIRVNSLIDVENAIVANQKEIKSIDEKLNQFENLKNGLSETINTEKENAKSLEDKINLLDENIKLTQTILSLDEHRQHLKDGEACPLCGALEHPFAQGNIPIIGNREQYLSELREQLSEVNGLILQNEKELVALVSGNKSDLNNKAREMRLLNENQEKQKKILLEINSIEDDFLIPQGDDKIEQLNKFLTHKTTELEAVVQTIEQADALEKQLVKLRDTEIPKLQEEKTGAEQTKNSAETALKLAEQNLHNKQESVSNTVEKYNTENEAFLGKLKKYEVENIGALQNCLKNWNDNKEQISDLDNLIRELENEIALKDNDLENQTESYNEKQIEKQRIETDKQKLSDKRKEIFAEKSVEEEENRLKNMIDDAEQAKTSAEQEKNFTNTEFEKNNAVIETKEEEYIAKKEQKITKKTSGELQREFDENKIKSEGFYLKIGANNRTLELNEVNLMESGSKLKEKESQQAVCNKWGKLNELVGSSDGKKYRNFAQALTFEHLVGLANGQLKKMSDRYILKRTDDNSNPFELSVIDKYQNSEERTAKNLSGGEKFIVSLSLALGLSGMASKNMRIDTMFIDEGFGTLDSDYLDVALSALSNLQSEGKIIGIISHLPELKERIATHIEVIPSGNGHSKIKITH